VKHISHIAGDFLRRLLKLVHLVDQSQRDTDFLGYEAYSSLTMVTSRGLSQGKVTEKANKAGFTVHGNETPSRKAA
jgi:hypothetical protein